MASAPSGAACPRAEGKLKLPAGTRCPSVCPGGTWLGDCVWARAGTAIARTRLVDSAKAVDLANRKDVIGRILFGWQTDTGGGRSAGSGKHVGFAIIPILVSARCHSVGRYRTLHGRAVL